MSQAKRAKFGGRSADSDEEKDSAPAITRAAAEECFNDGVGGVRVHARKRLLGEESVSIDDETSWPYFQHSAFVPLLSASYQLQSSFSVPSCDDEHIDNKSGESALVLNLMMSRQRSHTLAGPNSCDPVVLAKIEDGVTQAIWSFFCQRRHLPEVQQGNQGVEAKL